MTEATQKKQNYASLLMEVCYKDMNPYYELRCLN